MPKKVQYKSHLATDFLARIQSKVLDPMDLTRWQRFIVVRYMFHLGQWTKMEMKEILKVSYSTIKRDCKFIDRCDASVLNEMDDRRIALALIRRAEISAAALARKGDHRAAWQVEKELVEMMQTLGYISKEPIEIKGHESLLEVLNFGKRNITAGADDPGEMETLEGGNGRSD